MKLQYSTPSVRVDGRQRGRRGYNSWQGSASPSFGGRIARFIQETVRFFVHPVIGRRLVRVALFVVPITLVCNLVCSSLISGTEQEIAMIAEKKAALETTNITLLAKRAMTWGPDNMERLAKEKLDLAPAKKGQIGVFDRRIGIFRY